jgi:hypothetical protein
MTTCTILSECKHVIDVVEWVHAPRQGKKSNGQQNTQLELGTSKLKVEDVVVKLMQQLNICRIHQAKYEWSNVIRKIDMTLSHPDRHRIICTDFGATLDLGAIEKDNCSVNNHAVVCIFFVAYDWRRVQFKKTDKNGCMHNDEVMVNECDKWIFFGDTLSKGKKNDHVFHNACLTYIIRHYDGLRIVAGKQEIPSNIVWTDNCPTQYKCRQHFVNVAKASSLHNNKTSITHKFAVKYRFKGSWDATGKLVKQQIFINEMKYDRIKKWRQT